MPATEHERTAPLPHPRRSPKSLAALLLLSPAAAHAACPSTTWVDEFDGGSVDSSKWSFQNGDGCAEGICGWGNNELQTYQENNAVVSNGVLSIEAREERVRNKAHTSAKLRTINIGDWIYGRFEARIKMTVGQGIWPAFWMMPTDEAHGGWPQSGEIDIMENIGSEPSTVHGTIHYGDPWPNNSYQGGSYHLPDGQRFADGFHTFAVEREAGVIRWMVDDVLFSTKTRADVDPLFWPFDEQRFHFILNVAVGGNWPGNPDATTVFPQVLQVDHVRVYDGNFPHLAGEGRVESGATGVVYSVANAFPGSIFAWSVPLGVTIVSGQGTASVTLDFGTEDADIVVDIADECGTRQISMHVNVNPGYVFDFAFENFDDEANVALQLSTGTLTEVTDSDSNIVGEYTRNSAEPFDVLVYSTSAITDASLYSGGTKRFYMDVHTTAPVGTEILVQLEDSSVATPSNWPAGRHSRYVAFTSAQGQMETLPFDFVDVPDASTPDDAVDTIVVLFATNTNSGDVFTFDNFDSHVDGTYSGPVCGNDVLEDGEACDGDDLGGETCEGQGYASGGTLACDAGCALDATGCSSGGVCDGDGVCDEGEDCDNCNADCPGVSKGPPSGRHCCGNGIFEGPEGDGRCDGNN